MRIEAAFGIILAEQRKKAKLTQEALAHECGLDRTYISLLERGLRQPSLKTIFSIGSVLGMSPSKLIELVENIKSCDDYQRSNEKLRL